MTRNAMAKLTSDQQKQDLLGMRSFFKVTSSQLQVKLPLDNLLLRQLGCLNLLKREKSTVTSIQSIGMKLQPKVDPSKVTDEWKLFQVDNELSAYDPREKIEVYWSKVSKLQMVNWDTRLCLQWSSLAWCWHKPMQNLNAMKQIRHRISRSLLIR